MLTLCTRCNLPMVYPCTTDERADRCLNTKLPPLFQLASVVANGEDPLRIEWRSKTYTQPRRALKLAARLMRQPKRPAFTTYVVVPAGMGWVHRLPLELPDVARIAETKTTDQNRRVPSKSRRGDGKRRVRPASVPEASSGVGEQSYSGA